MIGAIFFFGSTALIVPTSVGINEYNRSDDYSKERIKIERNLQIGVLVSAVVFLVIGIYMMYTSNARNKLITHLNDFSQHTGSYFTLQRTAQARQAALAAPAPVYPPRYNNQ